jgi:hypothetical protein
MGAFAWVMTGIALWHFTIFLPDRFWAGIVGAFVGAVLGSFLFGFLLHGLDVPGQDDTTITTALEAVPGTMLGLAIVWMIGVKQERDRGERLDAFGRRLA